MINYNIRLNIKMSYPPYNDLLFEIYHYIPRESIPLINKVSRRSYIINIRILRYISYINRIKQYANMLSVGLYYTCKYRDVIAVKQLLHICKSTGDNIDSGLHGASAGNNLRLFKIMIKNGANIINVNDSFVEGCDNNSIKCVTYIIKKYRKYINGNYPIIGFRNACLNGNINIVKLLIKYNILYLDIESLNAGLRCSTTSRKIKIMKYLIKLGACDWNGALSRSCSSLSDNRKIIRYFIKHGATDFNTGLYMACGTNVKHEKLMIKMGATNCIYCCKSISEHSSVRD
jgi:ankyrin repeat protein